VVLAADQNGPLALALDQANLYWVDYDEGTIMKLPLAGGPPVTLATGQSHPEYIAVDATRVYWSTGGTNINPIGGIVEVPIAGGAPVVIASDTNALHDSVASDGSHVFWTSYQGGTVTRTAPDGSASLTIASGQQTPMGVVVGATSVFWSDETGGAVMKAPIDGGTPVPLASGQGVTSIALDATNVYWASGGLQTVPQSGGSPVMLAAAPGSGQNGGNLAIDDAYVYWGLDQDGVQPILVKVPKGGGDPVPLAPGGGTRSVFAVAVDASCVYWTEVGPSGAGDVMALAK
jgi:hypothetical protein